MNLMYGIGAITPLIVLNSLFLILVITVFRAVITVSSATLIITCYMLADFYDILSTLLSVIISIAFCIFLFLEGGGGCCLLFCLLLEL